MAGLIAFLGDRQIMDDDAIFNSTRRELSETEMAAAEYSGAIFGFRAS
jgi:hypothetical protein